ncbi:MAG: hypothetical protein AAGL24_24300 [Pseudomonadota bacterium]
MTILSLPASALAALGLLALFPIVPAEAAGFADRASLQALSGIYESAAPEKWYGGYGTREFVFHNGTWSLIFTHALDRDMTQRTFRFRTGGPFEVGQESPAVDGAFHTVFHERWKHVTLLTDDTKLIEAFGFSECALKVNLEVDISQSGCARWKPVAECGEDHDLFAMDSNGVYFGVRPRDNDMCTADKTPTALLPAVVKR